MIVIMLGGKARVGKTTAANILKVIAENAGMKPVIVPFAKAIKDEASRLGLSKEKEPEKYRAFCQELGEGKRKEDPDFWVNKFHETYMTLLEDENKTLDNNKKKYKERVILVDDCRYMNEVAYGRKIGAVQVFITHGNRQLEDPNGAWREHESETMANNIEANHKDYKELFQFKLPNDKDMNNFMNLLSQFSMVGFNLLAESLTLCECEVCTAYRQGRDINGDKLKQEIVEMIDNYYRKDKKKDG